MSSRGHKIRERQGLPRGFEFTAFVNGFATKKKLLPREIPPAAQAAYYELKSSPRAYSPFWRETI